MEGGDLIALDQQTIKAVGKKDHRAACFCGFT